MPRLFCFGIGYTGRAVADSLLADGWTVAGTCREHGRAAGLRAAGIEAWPLDAPSPLSDPARALAGTTHLLVSVPPGQAGDPVLAAHGDDVARLGALEWVGYLSTTGVYGDRGGGWVDEESPLAPTGPRGSRRVEAEEAWLRLWRERGVPVHLFRLAGIYGPGRNALRSLREGTARRIDKPGQVFSRIHVDDIVRTLRASMARPRPGRVYNVCDDDPAAPAEVIAFAAGLLETSPPPLVPLEAAGLSPMGRSFYDDNKRVRNDRIKQELGVALVYPDYRSGLRALLAAGEGATAPPAGRAG